MEESSVKSSSGEGTHGLCFQLLKILENEFQQQWLPEKGMSGAGGEKEKGANKRQEETEGWWMCPSSYSRGGHLTLKNPTAHLNCVHFIIYQLLLNKVVKSNVQTSPSKFY